MSYAWRTFFLSIYEGEGEMKGWWNSGRPATESFYEQKNIVSLAPKVRNYAEERPKRSETSLLEFPRRSMGNTTAANPKLPTAPLYETLLAIRC